MNINKTKIYLPSNFMAMFCLRQDESHDDASCNNFLEVGEVKPNLSITTRSYVVSLIQ